MAVYGYLRVSSDEQDVNNQKSGVVDFAKKMELEVSDWITDEGVSGTRDPEKRQLGILMKKCKRGDVIICSELSRLGRKMLMVMSVLEYCMKNGIMIYTVKDNYVLGDNVQSTVLAFAFSLASQIERDMIAMRTKEALAVRKKAGVLLGAPRTPKVESSVKPDELAEMIKLAENGLSLTRISEKMKKHRITIGYHLMKAGDFKGCLDGYILTYANGKKLEVTRKTARDYGLYYIAISDAYKKKQDLTHIGIVNIEPKYRQIGMEIKDALKVSSKENINREEIERYIMSGMTLPEMHQALQSEVTYDELYDYICEDTFLSNEYRKKGQLRCKMPKRK